MSHSPRLLLAALALSSLPALVTTVACSTENVVDVARSESSLSSCDTCTGGELSGDPLLAAVNRQDGLRSDWAPTVAELPENYFTGTANRLRDDARAAFIRMVDAARERDHVDLLCMSGYRSFDRQCELFASYADADGCDKANTYSAHAGHSEHQLGRVCDIALGAYVEAGSSAPFVQAGDEGDRWLTAHAHEYGFALSYPHEDASLNDDYKHEPWHYRYIGVAAAAELRRRGALAVPVFIASLTPEERAALERGEPLGDASVTAP